MVEFDVTALEANPDVRWLDTGHPALTQADLWLRGRTWGEVRELFPTMSLLDVALFHYSDQRRNSIPGGFFISGEALYPAVPEEEGTPWF